ncbi:MAG TPA: glycosyltransferase family 4 protein, partial [Chloroflexota bacterium]|nr:glycosyltransferase family 4 protein [Chloroflexota bacterium]
IDYTVAPPFSDSYYPRALHPRSHADRVHRTGLTACNRLRQLVGASRHDVVFIQRELMMYGPPVFERLFGKFNAHTVYDFDDAIWGYAGTDARSWRRYVVDYDKVRKVASRSKAVIAATGYLADRARTYNPNTVLIPDPINVDRVQPKTDYSSDHLTLGWIGNPANLPSLDLIAGALRKTQAQLPVRLKVVSSIDYHVEGVEVVNKRWSLSDEAADLRSFDVGLMPLPDTEVVRGKGGIKALMCMAAGVPVVCSAIGENLRIVEHGQTGLLASTEDEWVEALVSLARDRGMRQRIGRAGRCFVEHTYPVERLAPQFIDVLCNVASGRS